jgi:hypothetical protein
MRRIICYILIFSLVSFYCKKDTESYTNHTQESYNHDRNPGRSARDFLQSANYKSLKIEVQYMPGFRPDMRAINIFVELLNERLNKSAGIFVVEKEIDPTLMTVFSPSDISNIESRNRTVFTNGDQMSAYLLFTSGTYYIGNILGLAYKNTSICFFGEPINNFSVGVTENDKIKAIAMLLAHEFGHLLGLVDMGTSMVTGHRDTDNGNHCNNNACLMHHTFEPETQNFARIVISNPSFDANCINDLRGNGGK